MKLIGRHATEAERARMAAPFNTNTGQPWTLESICKCINKGADVAAQNPEIQQALEAGIQLLVDAGKQDK